MTSAAQTRYQASDKGKATKRARRMRRRVAVMFMVDLHKAVPCADCGGRLRACAMDFDHLPGEVKTGYVSQMANQKTWRVAFAEAQKCEVVCANCHRVRTADRRASA